MSLLLSDESILLIILNMTRFLAFLCQTWYQKEQSDPSICSTKFHLGGG